jgi:hypothetical protein
LGYTRLSDFVKALPALFSIGRRRGEITKVRQTGEDLGVFEGVVGFGIHGKRYVTTRHKGENKKAAPWASP